FAGQPAAPTDDCTPPSKREFTVVKDVHIGIVDSSLGGHGSDACDGQANADPSTNDHGHLVDRPVDSSSALPETFEGKGFLAWSPEKGVSSPPNEKVFGDGANGAVNTGLIPTLRDMVLGVNQKGCGFEATMESWYRFLVDPKPYATIKLSGN